MFNRIIAVLLLLFTLTAHAQTKPIKVIIPFGIGGLVDNSNRRLQEALAQELGRPIQIDSRPGAAGYIGLKHMATNKGDEVMISIIDAMAIANVILLHDDIAFEDFKYLVQIGTTTSVALAVKKGSPLKNLDQWKTLGRPINVGINGIAGAHHYYSWLFETQTKTPITYVPYKGVNEMLNNLIGGHIDAGWANLPALEGHEKSGKIDIVAVVHPQRAETMSHVPTFGELGVTTPFNAKWLLISNDTTDLATVKQVETTLIKLINDAQFAQTMKTTGINVEPKLVGQAQQSMTSSLKQQTKFIEYIKTTQRK
jgi:tripartite-type tricarboxylate transporter receptor subunit TctC